MKAVQNVEPVIQRDFGALPEALRRTELPKNRVMLVGDSHTMPLYGEEAAAALGSVFREVFRYTFPAGEEHKNLQTVEGLLRALLAAGLDRKDCIAALGGGVTGDMAGFAAAIYLRGIPVIQLPTTLLAQIDSSIGGKTGVDFDAYKNMVGAFHMPALVYSASHVLRTLPGEQLASGMGEVIKSAVLGDGALFAWLEAHAGEVAAGEEAVLSDMIRRTAAIKTGIVRRDPTEQGERALLNLGHTIGHAIEKAKGFSMLHGCCVAVGMMAAAHMSRRRGLLAAEEEERIRELLLRFSLPVKASGCRAEEILAITRSDKKMAAGRIRFILIRGIGEAVIAGDVCDEELMEGIESVLT